VFGVFVKNYSPNTTVFVNSDLTVKAIIINDTADLTDTEREEQLTSLFRGEGHSLVFLDGIAPWFSAAETVD
jgi:hypothetical protein